MSDVTMPQLGETVTEGTITKWFKKVGDTVAQDELLFEVSTDKVDSEVSSPASGVLMEIRVAEGDTVDVGAVLAVISADGAAAVVPPTSAPAAPAPVEAPVPAPAPVIETPVVEAPVAVAEPAPVAAAPAPVVEAPVAPPVVEAPVVQAPSAPPAAQAVAAPVPPVYAASPSLAADAPGMDKVLSPVVRKLINENGLNPALISGTGPGGRITREDVLGVLDTQGSASSTSDSDAPASAPGVAAPQFVAPTPVAPANVGSAVASVVANAAAIAAQSPSAPASAAQEAHAASSVGQPVPAQFTNTQQVSTPAASLPAVMPGGRDEVVKLSNIRRRTGEHMVMSLSTAPHAFIAVGIDYTAVDKVRNAQKAAFKAAEGFSLTYMPFIARAVVEAANKFPNVNASVAGDSLILHKAVHLGIAVDLDFNGLMVPVVRDADGKRMRAIARDISDLAARARGKKLSPDDITGGTFTLSNAGPYGIDLMQSIINQPQVGILSITSIKKKPVVLELPDGSDTIAIRPMGMLGLSWDHRAFDGAYAASFLAEIKSQLEGKDWSSEL
jgi:pyruvate dehydrogenase E2 component (dihydrolipoamide acetyltransferase)